jgi:hypothetical protein
MSIEITDWLRGLGLEQYAPAFRDNDVDSELLPQLTVDDLNQHRSDLRRPSPETVCRDHGGGAAPADRDVLRFGGLDAAVDTLRSRGFARDRRRVPSLCDRHRHPLGGFAAKYMGGGVVVYFAYPEKHEDNAERAARAGLAVTDAVGRLATQEPLNLAAAVLAVILTAVQQNIA